MVYLKWDWIGIEPLSQLRKACEDFLFSLPLYDICMCLGSRCVWRMGKHLNNNWTCRGESIHGKSWDHRGSIGEPIASATYLTFRLIHVMRMSLSDYLACCHPSSHSHALYGILLVHSTFDPCIKLLRYPKYILLSVNPLSSVLIDLR